MEEEKYEFATVDADGTFYRGSLLADLVVALIIAGIFPKEALYEYEKQEAAWRDREGAHNDYIMAVVHVFMKYIQGKDYFEILEVCKDVVEQYKKRTYVYTKKRIEELKNDGYKLIMISHSPKMIVDIFAKEHGFDKSYGIYYETDKDKKFTGKTMHQDLIMDKGKIIDRILADTKLNVGIKGSYAFGDTTGDISMFEKVEHPVLFNPNQDLIDYAKHKSGWQIVVERKDVIYHNPK